MERKLSKICTSYSVLFIINSLFFPQITRAQTITSTPQTPAIIIDGDSIEIGKHRIRLFGIDAPEYDQNCKDNNGTLYPCGKKATFFLKKLTQNEIINCKTIKLDQYKRHLCTCYAQNKDLNAEMILSGNAVTYLETNYTSQEKKAKQQKRGMWQGIFMHPRLYRIIKEHQKNNLYK